MKTFNFKHHGYHLIFTLSSFCVVVKTRCDLNRNKNVFEKII